jgi:hypothetical protein
MATGGTWCDVHIRDGVREHYLPGRLVDDTSRHPGPTSRPVERSRAMAVAAVLVSLSDLVVLFAFTDDDRGRLRLDAGRSKRTTVSFATAPSVSWSDRVASGLRADHGVR